MCALQYAVSGKQWGHKRALVQARLSLRLGILHTRAYMHAEAAVQWMLPSAWASACVPKSECLKAKNGPITGQHLVASTCVDYQVLANAPVHTLFTPFHVPAQWTCTHASV